MGSLQINMLGTSFSITANEDETYMKKLLNYYKQITEQIAKNGTLNSQQISILAGIMLCDELYKEKSKKAVEKSKEIQEFQRKEEALLKKKNAESKYEKEIEEITNRMLRKLDESLN